MINALNRDLPYDRFIVEQLAGDLLPGATQDQIVATGYLRNSMINEEGGVDPEQFRMDAMFDRMDAIGKGILGLTIQCAQCHDHKYDPLTQREYYRLFAFLNNDDEANIAVYTPDEQKQRADVLRQHSRDRKTTCDTARPIGRSGWPPGRIQAKTEPPQWTVAAAGRSKANRPAARNTCRWPTARSCAQGYAPTKHTVRLHVNTPKKNITAFRLELLNDPNLPRGGPGRSIQGTAALTEFAVEAQSSTAKLERLKFAKATADYNPPETPLDADVR